MRVYPERLLCDIHYEIGSFSAVSLSASWE
jgi:hypothetical protein